MECLIEGIIIRILEDEEIIVVIKINFRVIISGSRVNFGVRSYGVSIIIKDIIEYLNKMN